MAGRAGRKQAHGKVYLQAYNLNHPVVPFIIHYDYEGLARHELRDRESTFYPPYSRLIHITIKHKKPELADQGCLHLTQYLQTQYGDRVMGPLLPGIPRLRNYYLRSLQIKMEKNSQLMRDIKSSIRKGLEELLKIPGLSTTRYTVDVDPD